MEKYKRIFVIVLDSLGIGEMPDAARFGDHDVDTFGHICDIVGTLNIPNLKKLGLLICIQQKKWKKKNIQLPTIPD